MAMRKRIKFLGYLPCTIVAWVEMGWGDIWQFQLRRHSYLPPPSMCIISSVE